MVATPDSNGPEVGSFSIRRLVVTICLLVIPVVLVVTAGCVFDVFCQIDLSHLPALKD